MTTTLTYAPAEDTMFVGNLANRTLSSEADVDRVFDEIRGFWRSHCGGRKVYCVVDYTGVEIPQRLQPHFAKRQREAVDTYSITTVRWGATLVGRAALRAMAIKTHRPSNLYPTRDEALQVVRGIRVGRIKLDSSHPAAG